ncbi:replicative helicase loader/inhibitor [Virgibacillus sp. SK37]|uniref:replicative helicase loader/inhibitor n=1 Tax=Virgibacillus sp. SK37 TaxID=403957 RepID=UPI0011A82AA2|nr:replicative helicase loader/inhibitor [Virgibacillus sp. SK37]
MTENEAISIFTEITFAYPFFEVTDEKLDYWINQLTNMPYDPVVNRLKKHIYTSNYPPTISQIAAFEKAENTFLMKLEEKRKKLKHREDI